MSSMPRRRRQNPLLPDYLVHLREDEVLLKNYRGDLYSYRNVPPAMPAEERRQAVHGDNLGGA